MTSQAQTVLKNALRLSSRDRARVAAELLASIDGVPDPDADAAWAKEVERRARQALAGKSKTQAWPTVRERLRKSLRKR